MLYLEYGATSSKGKCRRHSADSNFGDTEEGISPIADSMDSYTAGEVENACEITNKLVLAVPRLVSAELHSITAKPITSRPDGNIITHHLFIESENKSAVVTQQEVWPQNQSSLPSNDSLSVVANPVKSLTASVSPQDAVDLLMKKALNNEGHHHVTVKISSPPPTGTHDADHSIKLPRQLHHLAVIEIMLLAMYRWFYWTR